MEWITEPHIWIGFFTLTALEIVLGIDNIVFISIVAGKLKSDQQKKARTVGLALAMLNCRGFRPAHPERLYLFCDGLLSVRRDAQSEAEKIASSKTARALRRSRSGVNS